jgi:hypothetical protein
MMGDVIPAVAARYHLQLFWSVGAALAVSACCSDVFVVTGVLFVAMNLVYGYNLFNAARIYFGLKDKGMF